MSIYKRLLTYIWPYRLRFIAAIIMMIIYAATETAMAAMLKPILDGSFIEKNYQIINWLPIILLLLFIPRFFAGFLSSYWMFWIGRQVVATLREQMFKRVVYFPASFFNQHPSGKVIAKFIYDVEQVSSATNDAIVILIRDSLMVLGLLFWMFYLSTVLTLLIFIAVPFIVAIVHWLNTNVRTLSKQIQKQVGEITQVLEQTTYGQNIIKLFNGQAYEMQIFNEKNRHFQDLQLKKAKITTLSLPLLELIVVLIIAFIIFLMTQTDLFQQSLSIGGFISFVTAMVLLSPPIRRLMKVSASLQGALAGAASIFELLDTKIEAQDKGQALLKAKGEVIYQGVNFQYNNDNLCLQDISFTVKPGQQIALVGHSGSGKSTLVNLLARLYSINSGKILLDGIDINAINLQDLRQQIAYIGQDVLLFNDSIAANIAYGDKNASQSSIEQAAEAAYVMEFVKDFPEGLNTQIGSRGSLLSGGQRQRIAIARALLKNAPILILDEATSALDSKAEQYIQSALHNLIQGRTCFIIAHRLSTLQHADTILVLQKGKIVESGQHHSLLAQKGLYAELYQLQYGLR